VNRLHVLREFGYVTDDLGALCDHGVLASEIHEGHPFLMTESMLRICKNKSLTIRDILIILSVFMGEVKDEGQMIRASGMSKVITTELAEIHADSRRGLEAEKRAGLIPDIDYWGVNEEWVEPIEKWLMGEHTLSSLAASFDLFEGNVQKALMKLASLLEEFQAVATVLKDVDMLKVLEEGRGLVLRDLILAESLYLRI